MQNQNLPSHWPPFNYQLDQYSNIYNSGIIDPNQMRMTNTSVQSSSILQNTRNTVSTSALPQSLISGRNTPSMSSIISSSNNFNPIFQVEKKSGPTVKEKQYQTKIVDLEEQLQEIEQKHKKELDSIKKHHQKLLQILKDEKKNLEDDLDKQNQKILDQEAKITKIQNDIKVISKQKTKIDDEKDQLSEDYENLKRKYENLDRNINNQTLTQTRGYQQQLDQQIQIDNQINQYKDRLAKQKEDSNNQIQKLEEELQICQKDLSKSIQKIEMEHKNFLDQIDITNSLKNKIQKKDDKIKQQDQQQDNIVAALDQANMQIQRLKEEIQKKDQDLLQKVDEIKFLNQYSEQLKQILLDSYKGQEYQINQDSRLDELEKQQKWMQKYHEENKEKIKLEIELNEKQRQEKLEKDKKKREQQKQQQIQKKDQLVQKGHQQMQDAKKEFGQLDVCFIVDVTGSMDEYKEQTKKSIQGSQQIIKQATNRDTNWASVCYQDKEELQVLKKYYEFPFSKDEEKLTIFFDKIQCDGGDDGPEDIRGAIKQVCSLNWPSRFKIAILICDAPCHGRKYHGNCRDNYPDEDIQDAIEQLIEKGIILIALNFTPQTTIMYEQIKLIYQSKKKQELFLYQDLQQINQQDLANIMAKYIGEASQNATQTNKNQTKSKQGELQQVIPREKEGAMEALCKCENFYNFEQQPNVKIVNTYFKVLRVELKQDEFDQNIETIEKIQCPQDFLIIEEGSWNCIRTEKPFAFGMMKDVFLMKKQNDYSNELYVIKTPIGSQPYKTLTLALNECRSHLICQKLMKKFKEDLDIQKLEKQKRIKIPSVIYSDFLILQESQDSFWIAERFFKGEFVKYNNNFGYINDDEQLELNKFAQAFTYYTYFISSFNYMVCDVQGVGNYFTDPAVNTKSGMFDDTDMGQVGQMMYLVNYENKKELLTKQYLELLEIYN